MTDDLDNAHLDSPGVTAELSLSNLALGPSAPIATATSAPPSGPDGRGRRWPKVLLLVALVAWGATSTVLAVQQRNERVEREHTLATTRSALERTETELEQTQSDLTDTQADRDQVAAELAATGDERDALDARLEDVAAEKASAEDEREFLRQIVLIAPEVTRSMAACADDNRHVTSQVLGFVSAYPYGSQYLVDAAIDRAEQSCAQAIDLADQLDQIVADAV